MSWRLRATSRKEAEWGVRIPFAHRVTKHFEIQKKLMRTNWKIKILIDLASWVVRLALGWRGRGGVIMTLQNFFCQKWATFSKTGVFWCYLLNSQINWGTLQWLAGLELGRHSLRETPKAMSWNNVCKGVGNWGSVGPVLWCPEYDRQWR